MGKHERLPVVLFFATESWANPVHRPMMDSHGPTRSDVVFDARASEDASPLTHRETGHALWYRSRNNVGRVEKVLFHSVEARSHGQSDDVPFRDA